MSTSIPDKAIPQLTEKPRLASGFLWITWSAVIGIANSLLIWVFMARFRDIEEVGKFSIVMGLYALFFSIVSLGLMPYLVNEISKRTSADGKPDDSVFSFIGSSSALLLLSGLATAAVMCATAFLESDSEQVRSAAMVLSIGLIPCGLITLAESTAISFGRAGLVAVSTTIENILRTIVPIMLIWWGFDFFYVCLSFAAVRFIALGVYLVSELDLLARSTFNKTQFREVLTACPTFAGITIFSSINWQAALLMLGYLATEAESAKYGVASRFLVPVTIMMASFASVLQPNVSRKAAEGLSSLISYLARSARIPLIGAIALGILTPLFAEQVLGILFGAEYQDGAAVLDILVLCIIPFSLVMISATGLIATGSQRIDLIANILGVIVCIATALVLIPAYGSTGAALAQLFSFISMAAVNIGYLSRQKVTEFKLVRTVSTDEVAP